jgi:hypothetical protein
LFVDRESKIGGDGLADHESDAGSGSVAKAGGVHVDLINAREQMREDEVALGGGFASLREMGG